jgi:hypothetical protein
LIVSEKDVGITIAMAKTEIRPTWQTYASCAGGKP